MFDIEICEAREIVLVRFRGQLSEQDFTALDKLANEARAATAAYDCIYDMTNVERIDLATEFVAARGDVPQAYKDRERIYVVHEADLKLLVRLYAAYQSAQGWRAPAIVATLAEAMSRLGVAPSDFSPMASEKR